MCSIQSSASSASTDTPWRAATARSSGSARPAGSGRRPMRRCSICGSAGSLVQASARHSTSARPARRRWPARAAGRAAGAPACSPRGSAAPRGRAAGRGRAQRAGPSATARAAPRADRGSRQGHRALDIGRRDIVARRDPRLALERQGDGQQHAGDEREQQGCQTGEDKTHGPSLPARAHGGPRKGFGGPARSGDAAASAQPGRRGEGDRDHA